MTVPRGRAVWAPVAAAAAAPGVAAGSGGAVVVDFDRPVVAPGKLVQTVFSPP